MRIISTFNDETGEHMSDRHEATHQVNDRANHRKAPVRRETEEERLERISEYREDDHMIFYDLVPGKAKYVKDICNR